MRPRRLSTGGGSFVGSFVGALWTLLFLPLEGLGRASVGIGYCCLVSTRWLCSHLARSHRGWLASGEKAAPPLLFGTDQTESIE